MADESVSKGKTRMRIVVDIEIDNSNQELINFLHRTEQEASGAVLSSEPMPVGTFEFQFQEHGHPPYLTAYTIAPNGRIRRSSTS